MVKTPRTRHSKTERDPMTIELGPDEVSRVATEGEASSADAESAAEGVKEDVGASAAAAEPPFEAASDASAAESEAAPREPNAAFDEGPKPAESQAARDDATGTAAAIICRGRAAGRPNPALAAVARLGARPQALPAALIALVAGGLLQFAGILGTPGGSTAPASVEAEIAALRSEIEGLKAGAGNAGEVSGRVDGLSQALDQVKTDVASLGRRSNRAARAEAGLEALNTKIAEIETRIDGASAPVPTAQRPEEIAAINEKIAGVEALAKAATEAGSTVTSRLGALEQSLSALSAKVDSQAQQPKVALAIAASALKAAIERGSPFEPELETSGGGRAAGARPRRAARLCREGHRDPRRHHRRDGRCRRSHDRGGEPALGKCRLFRAAAG